MILEIGRLALLLAGLTAAWGAVTGALALRTRREDLAETAWRGLVASTLCTWLGLAVVVAGFVVGDVTLRVVNANWSVLVPTRFLAAALLSTPGSAPLAWVALSGIAALGVVRSLRVGGAALASRAAATTAASAIAGAPLLVVALILKPLATRAATADGVGLSPDLQVGVAAVVAVALCLGLAAATVPFLGTIAALADHRIDDHWSRRVRTGGVAAAVPLLLAVAASARWHAMHPQRGAWLSDPFTIAWLFPTALALWLVWLGFRAPSAERTVMRALLAVGLFITASAALALGGGAFARGLATQAGTPVGIWLAIVPIGAIAAMIALVRGGGGALRGAAPLGAHRPVAASRILVGAGMVFAAAAAGGGYLAREHTVSLADGEIFRARDPLGGQWSFASQGVSTLRRDNFASLTVSLLPTRNETRLPVLNVEARSYLLADNSDAAPPAFVSGSRMSPLLETRVAMLRADGEHPTVRIAFIPLAAWLVVGTALICAGMLVALAPHAAEGQ